MGTIAVTSAKGGVGKTTTVVHLAAILVNIPDARILMVDLDSQGAVARYFGLDTSGPSVAEVLARKARIAHAIHEVRPRLFVLPADWRLATLEANRPRRAEPDNLAEILERERFTHVIIDTPPTLSWAMMQALFAADYLIFPTAMERLPIEMLDKHIETLEVTTEERNLRAAMKKSSILPTFYDSRTRVHRMGLDDVRRRYGDLVGTPVRQSTKVPAAAGEHKTLYEYAPNAAPAYDYVDLANEVVKWPAQVRQRRLVQ